MHSLTTHDLSNIKVTITVYSSLMLLLDSISNVIISEAKRQKM